MKFLRVIAIGNTPNIAGYVINRTSSWKSVGVLFDDNFMAPHNTPRFQVITIHFNPFLFWGQGKTVPVTGIMLEDDDIGCTYR